jgi:hypothetical protein
MKIKNNINSEIKSELDEDANDPELLLAAVTELFDTRPVEQLQYAMELLYEFYTAHHQPVGGAIISAVELITTFLKAIKEITTIPGPLNGGFDCEFSALGKRIHALRIAAGHDEELVADTIGIELSHLKRIEQGQCGDLRTLLLVEFAAYFNVPAESLLAAVPEDKFTAHGDS